MPLIWSDVLDALSCSRRKDEMRAMALALSLHPWRNTPEESRRLIAARMAIANWQTYAAACDERRNAKRRAAR